MPGKTKRGELSWRVAARARMPRLLGSSSRLWRDIVTAALAARPEDGVEVKPNGLSVGRAARRLRRWIERHPEALAGQRVKVEVRGAAVWAIRQ